MGLGWHMWKKSVTYGLKLKTVEIGFEIWNMRCPNPPAYYWYLFTLCSRYSLLKCERVRYLFTKVNTLSNVCTAYVTCLVLAIVKLCLCFGFSYIIFNWNQIDTWCLLMPVHSPCLSKKKLILELTTTKLWLLERRNMNL